VTIILCSNINYWRPCEASSGCAGTSTEPGAASGGGFGRSEEAESSILAEDGLKLTSESGGADCGSPTPITTTCLTCGSLNSDNLVPTTDSVASRFR